MLLVDELDHLYLLVAHDPAIVARGDVEAVARSKGLLLSVVHLDGYLSRNHIAQMFLIAAVGASLSLGVGAPLPAGIELLQRDVAAAKLKLLGAGPVVHLDGVVGVAGGLADQRHLVEEKGRGGRVVMGGDGAVSAVGRSRGSKSHLG